jgi:hypothetical protein
LIIDECYLLILHLGTGKHFIGPIDWIFVRNCVHTQNREDIAIIVNAIWRTVYDHFLIRTFLVFEEELIGTEGSCRQCLSRNI